VNKQTRKHKIVLTKEEIAEIYFDIETKSKLFESKLKANKASVNLTMEDAQRIYIHQKDSGSTYAALINYLIKTKNSDVKFTVDDLIKLYKADRNLKKITEYLVKAKDEGVVISADEIKTLFYNKEEYNKILNYYITCKEEDLEINVNQIKVLFLKNIDIQKAISVLRTLKIYHLKVPFETLLTLLDEKINITKCIRILRKAKEACFDDLKKEEIFDDATCNQLANTYVIGGKDKFKIQLSNNIVNTNRLIDPADLYHKLMTKESKGFKVTLETIKDYIHFDFVADIDEITKAYLKARTSGLRIEYKQLARLAEISVDVHEFVDAKIKSEEYV